MAPREEWDVFISYASEDKDAIARPLAESLKAKGLRVWHDDFALLVEDSLPKKIDHGLANSRFGIVILSRHFFEKHWPEQELSGLATREVGGRRCFSCGMASALMTCVNIPRPLLIGLP